MELDERTKQREARRRARQGRKDTDPSKETVSDVPTYVRRDSKRLQEILRKKREQEEEQQREEERLHREKEAAEELERQRIMQEQEALENERLRLEEERQIKELEEAERLKKEEEARLQAEEEEARLQAEEAAKAKPKCKGLGGLSIEKKKMLRKLILQKAAEEMKLEARKRLELKENHLKSVVPNLDLNVNNEQVMITIVEDLYSKMYVLQEEKYDLQTKISNIEYEINELGLQINAKGKFVKPVLKKVTKNNVKRLQKHKDHNSFRNLLKSNGQNKYALDENSPKFSDNSEENHEIAELISMEIKEHA